MRAIALIIRRSLRQHALSSAITAVSVALACGLLMSVVSIKHQSYRAFTSSAGGFDAVLGARGSELQIVLSSVFHLETSTGNLPWSVYQEMKNDRRVAAAIPIAIGDNYKGYRIVGVGNELFQGHEYGKGRTYEVERGGRFFDFDEPRAEAVIGAVVADRLNLRLEDNITSYHGLSYNEKTSAADRHDLHFKVVGILKPTNTPADNVIWIPLEGYYRMGGHELYGSGERFVPTPGEAIPDEHKEVSAVLLRFKSPTAGFQLRQTINKQGRVATLAWPIAQKIADLFSKVAWVERILQLVAYLVMIVAAASILASIYNAMNERRREFAILRALGARRRTVFSAIIGEAVTIAAIGAIGGYLFSVIVLAVSAVIVRRQTGVVLDVFAWHPVFLGAPLGMIVLGALAGLAPAVKAYRTDVASNLAPVS